MGMIYTFKGELKYVLKRRARMMATCVIVVVTLDSGARRGRLTCLGGNCNDPYP